MPAVFFHDLSKNVPPVSFSSIYAWNLYIGRPTFFFNFLQLHSKKFPYVFSIHVQLLATSGPWRPLDFLKSSEIFKLRGVDVRVKLYIDSWSEWRRFVISSRLCEFCDSNVLENTSSHHCIMLIMNDRFIYIINTSPTNKWFHWNIDSWLDWLSN